MTFVGRERELSTLERLYTTGSFQMPVIYGRRRVGKTSLITHFIEGKPAVYFSARESTARENLEALSVAIGRLEPDGLLKASDAPSPVFATFEQAFEYVFDLAAERRIVFVIDEYPYLAESDRSVSSVLQHLIDGRKEKSKLFLILCGSSMSFMEHQVLGYKSPLYGRRTAQIKVEPFDILQASQLLAGIKAENLVTWYGIAGGVPLYLQQIDQEKGIEENLALNVFQPDAFLYGEPDAFLQQEVREPARYNAIIRAIAEGEGRLSDIASVSGIDRTAVATYLKNLIELGIVRQELPVVDANRKKMRYALADNLFRFWYRFVPRYLTPLQAGRAAEVAELVCENHLSTFTGPVFEEVCRQWLLAGAGLEGTPFILDIGRWWGTDPQRKEQAEIDVVATRDDGSLICGECKWQNKLVDVDVLETLRHRAAIIQGDRGIQLYLFAKRGFTDRCREAAEEVGATLIALSDMGLEEASIGE